LATENNITDSVCVECGRNNLFRVKVLHSSETELCRCPRGLSVKNQDYVVLPTKYGKDLGRVLGEVKHLCSEEVEEIIEITRLAEEEDLQRYKENRAREEEALAICREKVEAHNLEMKLVSAHYLTEESKLLFFFTAESRVDFRALVKDLVSIFKMRIELRQIGVRDESRVIGGLGVCGRVYCCHGITDHLKPVSIRMAKEQNLSLNSMKISGPCGRLLCCLSYEYDVYSHEKSSLPSEGTRIKIESEVFKVIEVNILNKKIKMLGAEERILELPFDKFEYKEEQRKWVVRS